ncbi:MAG TPA: GNAT family N-acetyltransferase [Thermoleophilaceae bacterium]|jgi:predicted GNAT family acetyltransferase
MFHLRAGGRPSRWRREAGRRSIPRVAIEVRDNADEERYEVTVDGEPAGLLIYRLSPGVISLTHTEVDGAFGGRGVGSALIGEALDDARRRELEVLPICPFVKAYLQKHREYTDLVPEQRREAFGL